MIQRGIEAEVAEFFQRARYERTPQARGSRNGVRTCRIQTAESEVKVASPQIRNCAARFVPGIIPGTKAAIGTRSIEALVIGALVRGLSDRTIETFIEEASPGTASQATVSCICQRDKAFRARSLKDIELLVPFLDAIYHSTRPSGEREAILLVSAYTTDAQRALFDICLTQRARLRHQRPPAPA